MKLSDLGPFGIHITQENLKEAVAVRQTMETPGWKILDAWFDAAREVILEEGKLQAVKDSEVTAKLRWAILEGFDRYRTLPLQVKAQVDNFKSEGGGIDDGSGD